ncbi:unnamed protein product, partial [Brenthis ino]
MMEVITILLFALTFIRNAASHDFRNSPLLTAYPCGVPDVMLWYDPSLPAREKNRYYVYINRIIPNNSLIRISFDEQVIISFNFRTELGKFVRYFIKDGNSIIMNAFREFQRLGLTVKGVVPGVMPYITTLLIGEENLCQKPTTGYLDSLIRDNWNRGPQLNCGRPKVIHSNTTKGKSSRTRKGDWPWHSAIYRSDETNKNYICSGTLISNRFILTAAHCVSSGEVPLLPELLTVVLGQFDLKKKNKKTVEKAVGKVIVHQKFIRQDLYNDIALLKLKGEVLYNSYIQPACLWYSNANKKLPSNLITGTVLRWGYNLKAQSSHQVRKTEIPIVPLTTCLFSNPDFYGTVIMYDIGKFCAGYPNKTSACNGDSGSAFLVLLPDLNESGQKTNTTGAYYVKGIVSLTVSKFDSPVCAANQYVVFTDVEEFRTWIDAYIEEEDI